MDSERRKTDVCFNLEGLNLNSPLTPGPQEGDEDMTGAAAIAVSGISALSTLQQTWLSLPPRPGVPSSDEANWRRRDNDQSWLRSQSSTSAVGSSLRFKDHRVIGHYVLGEAAPSIEPRALDIVEPTLREVVLLPRKQINELNGANLSVNYDETKKIQDYSVFHEIKQLHLYRWFVDHYYFQNIGFGKRWKKPDFIANHGRIVDAFITPMLQNRSWQFYAVKYHGIIFLTSLVGDRTASSLKAHCGKVYHILITGENPQEKTINEFEKLSAAIEVSFEDHQLLLVTGSGVDGLGNPFKSRAYQHFHGYDPYQQEKFLKFWAMSIVPGVKSFVLGHRKEYRKNDRHNENILMRTSILSPEELWEMTGCNVSDKEWCYTFANQLLDFVKQQFSKNDRSVVKRFDWAGVPESEKQIVSCKAVVDPDEIKKVSEFILPDWFVTAAFGEQQKLD